MECLCCCCLVMAPLPAFTLASASESRFPQLGSVRVALAKVMSLADAGCEAVRRHRRAASATCGLAFVLLLLLLDGAILLVVPLVFLLLAVVSAWTVVPFVLFGGFESMRAEEEEQQKAAGPPVPRRPEPLSKCGSLAYSLANSKAYLCLEPCCFRLFLFMTFAPALALVASMGAMLVAFVAARPILIITALALTPTWAFVAFRRRIFQRELAVPLTTAEGEQAPPPRRKLTRGQWQMIFFLALSVLLQSGLVYIAWLAAPSIEKQVARLAHDLFAVREDGPSFGVYLSTENALGVLLGIPAGLLVGAFLVYRLFRRQRPSDTVRDVELQDGPPPPLVL